MRLGHMVLPIMAGGLAAAPALASELTLELTLPQLETAPYYRPYLAAWIEPAAGGAPLTTLAVWYDTRLRDNIGVGFLKDLRSWWRAEGKAMTLPADGISGPTRGPGTHRLTLTSQAGALASLPPGRYRLAVEIAREKGGHELVHLPLDWTGVAATAETTGTAELGALRLSVTP